MTNNISNYMNQIFEKIAQENNTTPEEVRSSISECIDAAYAATDPSTQAKQTHLFPNGKPSPESFIIQLAKQIK